jgi:hypothetical protein
MKKLTPTLLLLFSISTFASSEATILKVSKTINSKNILHYKVKYDPDTCEIRSDIYAEWKMDEDDGKWKSLQDSMDMIREPLEPVIRTRNNYEVEFITESMKDFQKKKILSTEKVRVTIETKDDGLCTLKNQIEVQGVTLNVSRIHSKVTIFGNVKWVQIIGQDQDGEPYNRTFQD